jgi:hypothetical protein
MTKAFVRLANQQTESLSISKQQLEQNSRMLTALTGVATGIASSNLSSGNSMAAFSLLAPPGSSSSSMTNYGSTPSYSFFSNRPLNAKSFDEPDLDKKSNSRSSDVKSVQNTNFPCDNSCPDVIEIQYVDTETDEDDFLLPDPGAFSQINPQATQVQSIESKYPTPIQSESKLTDPDVGQAIRKSSKPQGSSDMSPAVQLLVPQSSTLPTSAFSRVDYDTEHDAFPEFEQKYQSFFQAKIPKSLWMERIDYLKTHGYREELKEIDSNLQTWLDSIGCTETLAELKDRAQSKRRSAKSKNGQSKLKMDIK